MSLGKKKMCFDKCIRHWLL